MKRDQRGFVIELSKKVIPRNEKGDPAFRYLAKNEDGFNMFHPHEEIPLKENAILNQFTPEEVVFMVNRYLYSAEYQRTVHRERARDQASREAPLKEKVEELFGVKWTRATEFQLKAAAAALLEEREKGSSKG